MEDLITNVGVVVVDDQIVFRQVVRDVIAMTPGFEMVGEAPSGEEALATVDDLHPDLVLLDVRMPGMDGVETAARLCSADPSVVVVLISIDEAPYLPGGVSSSGAAEIVRKQDFGSSLLRRVWRSHRPAARS
jgi:DNA-binding NarL/FixJ family response regulator